MLLIQTEKWGYCGKLESLPTGQNLCPCFWQKGNNVIPTWSIFTENILMHGKDGHENLYFYEVFQREKINMRMCKGH